VASIPVCINVYTSILSLDEHKLMKFLAAVAVFAAFASAAPAAPDVCKNAADAWTALIDASHAIMNGELYKFASSIRSEPTTKQLWQAAKYTFNQASTKLAAAHALNDKDPKADRKMFVAYGLDMLETLVKDEVAMAATQYHSQPYLSTMMESMLHETQDIWKAMAAAADPNVKNPSPSDYLTVVLGGITNRYMEAIKAQYATVNDCK